jgi:hypothetical protein
VDDRTDDCAFGADDVAILGQKFRKLRFQMIADNYDLLFEDLFASGSTMSQRNLPLITGIEQVAAEGRPWSPSTYENGTRGIHYYRLHGCVCWYYHGPTDRTVYYHRTTPAPEKINNLCAMYPGRELYRGDDPHGYSFRRMEQALKQCEAAVFIGFSFRDDDVMHILVVADACRSTPLPIIVVDPNLRRCDVMSRLEEAKRKTQHVVGRPGERPSEADIVVINERFGYDNEAFKAILGRVKPALQMEVTA